METFAAKRDIDGSNYFCVHLPANYFMPKERLDVRESLSLKEKLVILETTPLHNGGPGFRLSFEKGYGGQSFDNVS